MGAKPSELEKMRAGGDLGRLLEAEDRLQERLVRAEDEARRIVEAARTAAGEAESALESRVEEAIVALRRSVEEEARRAIEEIEGEKRVRLQRLARVGPQEIEELAEQVVLRVIEAGASGPGGDDRSREPEAGDDGDRRADSDPCSG